MPHEDVMVDCDVRFCHWNENWECTCDCDIHDISADDIECGEFGMAKSLTMTEKDFGYFMEAVKEKGIPFVSIDENSLNFETVRLSDGKTILVQGAAMDIPEFKFWRDVDGGYGCTHKDQLELSFS